MTQEALNSEMVSPFTPAKFSLLDYQRMIRAGILDDRHVELIHGEIVEMSPEGQPHAYSQNEAGWYLTNLLGDRARVRYGNPITLPASHSEPEPDIAVVKPLGRIYRERHPHPDDIFWLIEYANSSLSKDLEVKANLYAEAGIPEYWIVNLQTEELIVMRSPSVNIYQTQDILKDGVISALSFPDLAIEVAKIINA